MQRGSRSGSIPDLTSAICDRMLEIVLWPASSRWRPGRSICRSIDRRAAKKAIAPHAIAYWWTPTVRRVPIPDAASCLLRRKTTEEAGKTGAGQLLQVRLEIAVVANLLVDLQPIALAVGDDDRCRCRIELDRGREAEAPLRLEALHPAPRLLHVGVGVDALLAPFRQYLGIADQLW